jgi:hypothetical protein
MPNKIPRAWQILLSGHSDRYAYDLGLLDQRIPFEQLKELAHINDLAETHYDAPDFSQKIRARVGQLQSHALEAPILDTGAANGEPAAGGGRPSWSSRLAQWRESLQGQGRVRTARRRGDSSDVPDPVELSIEE